MHLHLLLCSSGSCIGGAQVCLSTLPYIVAFKHYNDTGAAGTYKLTFVCSVGIGNSSETDYVRGFTHYAKQNGYRVARLQSRGSSQGREVDRE